MNILNIFGGAGYVGKVAARAMLAAFGLPGAAAGVHKKQRSFGIHRNGRDDNACVFRKDLVNPGVATFDKRRSCRTLGRMPPPNQDLVYLLACVLGSIQRDISARFVVDHLAIAVVTIHCDEDAAAGVGGAHAASFAAESSKYNGVNY